MSLGAEISGSFLTSFAWIRQGALLALIGNKHVALSSRKYRIWAGPNHRRPSQRTSALAPALGGFSRPEVTHKKRENGRIMTYLARSEAAQFGEFGF
jgi:hypothetical protein